MRRDARSERVLLYRARAGSDSDFEQLFRLHWPQAFRAAYLIVHDQAGAEDIAQEAFVAGLRAIDRFDRRRPFGPWLHRIVVNRAIDWTRARQLRNETTYEQLEVADELGQVPREAGVSSPIVAALATLSPEQRAVIVLRYLLEYTPGEIACFLDLPRGTVNSRLRRGLDQLGALLERDELVNAQPAATVERA
jgi:RNA polymerase sigma-70 factor, ECF subfamily